MQYYQLAYNVHCFSRLKWVMERSLTTTLAGKHRTRVSKIYKRYAATLQRPEGTYKGLRVVVEREGRRPLVAEWGGIPLRRRKDAVLNDQPKRIWNVGTELLQRLTADSCELCGSREQVEVHHVRALKTLQPMRSGPKPEWAKVMIARKRKTLIVCHKCHLDIQHGRPWRHRMRRAAWAVATGMSARAASDETIAQIRALASPMLGLQAWGASLGYGSFITIEFGDPSEKQGHIYGDWHFWAYGCVWRLEEPGTVLAASEDEREVLVQAVKHLDGLTLQRIEIHPPALDTTLVFEGDVVLRLFSIYTDSEGMAHWMLFMPDGNVLTVGPGSSWALHPSSEPAHN